MSEELIARLRKRMEEDRQCAANSKIVADLLQPQMDAFEARDGHNVYAVRMAVDHRNSVKRDTQYADDLEAAIALLASPPAKPAPADGMREEEAPSIWPLGHGVVMTAAGEEDFAGHLFFAAVPDEMIGEPGQAGDKRDFQSLMSSNGPRMIIRFADEAAIDAHIALCEQARSALSSTTPEQR